MGRQSPHLASMPRWVYVSLVTVILVAVTALVIREVQTYQNAREITCTVSATHVDSDGFGDMRVYTEECGVLRLKNMIFSGKTNADEMFASIETGVTYRFSVSGNRVDIPLMGALPVIHDFQVEEEFVHRVVDDCRGGTLY